jgi:hypothetical protein
MSWWSTFLLIYLLWIVFNWLAPLSVIALACRMSTASLPGEIIFTARQHKVRYYKTRLNGGYAFTVWCWPYKLVFIDEGFLHGAAPHLIRWVLAHELGHIVYGHTWRRWLYTVTGLILFKRYRWKLLHCEKEADKFADGLTGVPKVMLQATTKPVGV